MRVHLTGTLQSGAAVDFETDVPDDLKLGDSFLLRHDGDEERVIIAEESNAFTSGGDEHKAWVVKPFSPQD
jgi:hypothetical protein